MFQIFDDDKENVEVRLNAFLILMDKHMPDETLQQIVESAFHEKELNQSTIQLKSDVFCLCMRSTVFSPIFRLVVHQTSQR